MGVAKEINDFVSRMLQQEAIKKMYKTAFKGPANQVSQRFKEFTKISQLTIADINKQIGHI